MRFLAVTTLLTLFVLPAGAADQQPEIKDVVGLWQLEFTSPDEIQRKPTVVVGWNLDKFVAWYIEDGVAKGTPEAFEIVSVKDDTLQLSFKPQELGGGITVKFDAKLQDQGTCAGTGEYTSTEGDSGSWEFKGKKMPTSDFEDAQTWKLSFTGPDDVARTPMVTVATIGEKLYAWYSGKDYELPATEITATDDQVVMTISAKTPDGEDITLKYTGTIDGENVKGEAQYELAGESGSFPFEGKLQ